MIVASDRNVSVLLIVSCETFLKLARYHTVSLRKLIDWLILRKYACQIRKDHVVVTASQYAVPNYISLLRGIVEH